jgi:hypothetical protein
MRIPSASTRSGSLSPRPSPTPKRPKIDVHTYAAAPSKKASLEALISQSLKMDQTQPTLIDDFYDDKSQSFSDKMALLEMSEAAYPDGPNSTQKKILIDMYNHDVPNMGLSISDISRFSNLLVTIGRIKPPRIETAYFRAIINTQSLDIKKASCYQKAHPIPLNFLELKEYINRETRLFKSEIDASHSFAHKQELRRNMLPFIDQDWGGRAMFNLDNLVFRDASFNSSSGQVDIADEHMLSQVQDLIILSGKRSCPSVTLEDGSILLFINKHLDENGDLEEERGKGGTWTPPEFVKSRLAMTANDKIDSWGLMRIVAAHISFSDLMVGLEPEKIGICNQLKNENIPYFYTKPEGGETLYIETKQSVFPENCERFRLFMTLLFHHSLSQSSDPRRRMLGDCLKRGLAPESERVTMAALVEMPFFQDNK